ncbi:MAG: hypothetical protein AAFS10_14245 [Myxococcota bacterium]
MGYNQTTSIPSRIGPVLAALAVLLGACVAFTASAQAQSKVLVVPFEREQVDEAFYQRLMAQIKDEINATGEYEVMPDIEQEMSDLLFSVGCAEPEPECLQQIGESLGADMILYGSLWRNGPVCLQTVNFFDALAATSVLDAPIERTFETEDEELLFNMLVAEVQQIFYPFTGEVTVTTTEDPGVEILFDGVPVGDTSAGPLSLTGRPLGEHVITARVVIEGETREVNQSVVLLKEQPVDMTVDMTVAEPVSSFNWSYVALGVGGAALIGGAVFSILTANAQSTVDDLGDIESNPTIDTNEANNALNSGPNYATTQFVLYGIGTAALITGAVLWYFEGSDEEGAPDQTDAPAALITPFVTPDGGAGAGAIIQF